MKKNLLLILAICVTGIWSVNAQVTNLTPEQIKTDKDAKIEEIKALQEGIDKLDAALATMDYSGWKFGGNGGVAFSGAGASNWQVAGDPITNGLTTNITVNAFANMTEDKYFWYNGGNLQLGYLSNWTDLTNFKLSDLTNKTLDKLYISSLPGYRINSELAVTGLLDIQTALGAFADPATISGGVGVTWTPVQTMDGKLIPLKVVFHPLTWKGTYVKSDYIPSVDDTPIFTNDLRQSLGLEAGKHLASDFGLKFVADYARTIKILGNSIGWTTQLRGFAPYTQIEALIPNPAGGDPIPSLEDPTGPLELNWDNAFSVNLFKNLAVSANWNLRNYKPETAFLFNDSDPDNDKNWQHLWNFGFGLSTTF